MLRSLGAARAAANARVRSTHARDGRPRVTVDRAKYDALQATLDAVWENSCPTCQRPYHPRAESCVGCELDALRAALANTPANEDAEGPNEAARG